MQLQSAPRSEIQTFKTFKTFRTFRTADLSFRENRLENGLVFSRMFQWNIFCWNK